MRVFPCLVLISPSLLRWRLSRPALLMLLSDCARNRQHPPAPAKWQLGRALTSCVYSRRSNEIWQTCTARRAAMVGDATTRVIAKLPSFQCGLGQGSHLALSACSCEVP